MIFTCRAFFSFEENRPAKPSGVVCKKGHVCVRVPIWGHVCRGRVMEVGGLNEHFWKQGQSVGVQKCLDGFRRRCINYLGWQFAPKLDSTIPESVLTAANVISPWV